MEPNADNEQATPQPQPMAPMPQTNFELTVSAVLKNCWSYFTANLGVYVGLYIASMVLSFVIVIPLIFVLFATAETTTGIAGIETTEVAPVSVIGVIFIAVLAVVAATSRIIASMYAASLHIMQDGGKPTFGEAWSLGKPHFTRVLVVTLVVSLITVLGFFALIIPGLIALTVLFVAGPAAVDKNLGVSDALNESRRLVKGRGHWVFSLIIILGILNVILSIIPILGQILSAILGLVLWLMPVYVYLGLKQEKDGLAKAHPAGGAAPGVVGMPVPGAQTTPGVVEPTVAEAPQPEPATPEPETPLEAAPVAPEAPKSNDSAPPSPAE